MKRSNLCFTLKRDKRALEMAVASELLMPEPIGSRARRVILLSARLLMSPSRLAEVASSGGAFEITCSFAEPLGRPGRWRIMSLGIERLTLRAKSEGLHDLMIDSDQVFGKSLASIGFLVDWHERPPRLGGWRGLSPAQKHFWLEACLHATGVPDEPVSLAPALYEVSAHDVEDYPSLYCRLGELMRGPGGYVGYNLDALNDCFHGLRRQNTIEVRFYGCSRITEVVNRTCADLATTRRLRDRHDDVFAVFCDVLRGRGVTVNSID